MSEKYIVEKHDDPAYPWWIVHEGRRVGMFPERRMVQKNADYLNEEVKQKCGE